MSERGFGSMKMSNPSPNQDRQRAPKTSQLRPHEKDTSLQQTTIRPVSIRYIARVLWLSTKAIVKNIVVCKARTTTYV